MDKQEKIHEFKKEFADEIDSINIDVDYLKKRKVSTLVLGAESFLRKVFGDEIYIPKKFSENISGEKEIVKITEEDMVFDCQVREICDNIADVDFDNKLGLLLSKINNEEE